MLSKPAFYSILIQVAIFLGNLLSWILYSMKKVSILQAYLGIMQERKFQLSLHIKISFKKHNSIKNTKPKLKALS